MGATNGNFDWLNSNTGTNQLGSLFDAPSIPGSAPSFMSDLSSVQDNSLTVPTGTSPFSAQGLGDGQTFGSGFNFGASPSFAGADVPGGDSFWGSAMGENGWAAPAASMLMSAGSFYNGYQQNKLAQDSLDTQKQQFSDQFGVQKQLVNQDIMDQGLNRANRDPNGMTAEDYYAANKIN